MAHAPLAEQVPGLREEVGTHLEKFRKEEALAHALEKEIAKRKQEVGESSKKVEDLLTVQGSLRKDIEARDKELAAALMYRDKYAAAELRWQMSERALGQSKIETAKARADAENRFAGIALTGKRVIFLVDMSGSMELVDEKTIAPEKWQGVRDSLVKIMRSLPELEKFQVELFSDKPSFLLGQENAWFDYNPQTSAEQVYKALAAIKPRGGTNMYAALESAFRFRQAGMDTIYLFSDGLPNLGEGLPANAASLKEFEQAEILGKHIRNVLKTKWNQEMKGQPRVRINAVGFFYESPDLGAFLWALSRENEGSFVGMSKP